MLAAGVSDHFVDVGSADATVDSLAAKAASNKRTAAKVRRRDIAGMLYILIRLATERNEVLLFISY